MIKFRDIVWTPREPEDQYVLWYTKGVLRYFDEGNWKPFNVSKSGDIQVSISSDNSIHSLQEVIDYLDISSKNFSIYSNKEERDKYMSSFNIDSVAYVQSVNKYYRLIEENKTRKWIELTELTTKYTSLFPKVRISNYSKEDNTCKIISNVNITSTKCALVTDINLEIEKQPAIIISRPDFSSNEWTISNLNNITIDEEKVYTLLSNRNFGYVFKYSDSNVELLSVQINIDSENIVNYAVTKDVRVSISEINNNLNTLNNTSKDNKLEIATLKTQYKGLNTKIDNKVIEAGGVPFDIEPVQDSINAVYSGGVYSYIDKKFVTLTEEEYDALEIKNPETYYFVYES